MSELVGIDNLALSNDGPTLSMSISNGNIVGVFGPSGAGKSEFLRVLCGESKPARGKVNLRCEALLAESVRPLRRVKPVNWAKSGSSPEETARATEALLATHLWDVRSKPISLLPSGQQAAAELLRALTSQARLLLFDTQLDALDPWTLRSVLGYLRKLRSRGVSTVIATNKLDLLKHVDMVVLLENRMLRFAGNCDDLLRQQTSNEFTVTANDQPGALALVAPFAISIEEQQNELRFRANEGQEIAARLLLEGYGNVTLVVNRQPSLEESLLALLR